jgi:predicted nucleic acid-binding protein
MDECGFSSFLKSLFETDEVKSYLSDKFILHEVDFEEREDIVEEFMIDGTPRLVFLRSDGTEYFRRYGVRRGMVAKELIDELELIYSADSDIDKQKYRDLLSGSLDYDNSVGILSTLLKRGVFSQVFKALNVNKLKTSKSLHIRAEAYFRLGKISRSRLFFLLSIIEELKEGGTPEYQTSKFGEYYLRFNATESVAHFFNLLDSLIINFPDKYSLFIDYSALSRKTDGNFLEAVEKMEQIPKELFEPRYYWIISQLMHRNGDCSAIEKLLVENEVEEPYRRAVMKELEDCLSK